jgi:L-2-hydroxyglutarate oxidase LhgO
MFDFENVIIGSGVVGLAIARELAQRGREVLLVEKERSFGMGISSRNSEVIHAGIYYAEGSQKAFHCVRGRKMLYDYCLKKGVPFKKTGKLIIATDPSEDEKLEAIAAQAQANGLVGEDALSLLKGAEARELEPELSCSSALLSPSTGIIDSHAYMKQLTLDAQKSGAEFSFGTTISQIEPGAPHRLAGSSLGEDFNITAQRIFVAAGLHTANICKSAGLQTPESYWLKGNYFLLNSASPFRRLIYPVPVEGGLGVHVTIDMGGQTRFGPDTQVVKTENYNVDPARLVAFESAVRRYWPGLPDNSLSPGYAGIRPKLKTASGHAADFIIDGPEQLGIDGLVALHGIESPGLTSSLSLGEAAYHKMFSRA